jgi:hypothetical protein
VRRLHLVPAVAAVAATAVVAVRVLQRPGTEWKYVPIRHLRLFIEESLDRGTKWEVFEPKDEQNSDGV